MPDMNDKSPDKSPDTRLRHELRALLLKRNAHLSFEDVIEAFPIAAINERPPNTPYTFWHLVEHLRIAQADILDFIHNPHYQARDWPEGYWPDTAATATGDQWHASIDAFQRDRAALVALVDDPHVDLHAELPHAPGYTILREILVIADHNAYHIGELGILRQVMDLWD